MCVQQRLKQTPPQPVVHLAAILKYIRDLGILEADSALVLLVAAPEVSYDLWMSSNSIKNFEHRARTVDEKHPKLHKCF